MMEVHEGLLCEEVEPLFTSGEVNKTYRRRIGSGSAIREIYKDAFKDRPKAVRGLATSKRTSSPPQEGAESAPPSHLPEFEDDEDVLQEKHEAFMRETIQVVRKAARGGMSKEREPFGAVVVHDGKIIARATNSVLRTRDATATAEINAIRAASQLLNTYDLSRCTLYSTAVPDVMSMAACLWARIPKVYCGVSQEYVLRFGHEEGWLQFQELMTGRPEDRAIQTVDNVAKALCEDVFKFWSSLEGKIY